MMIQDKDKAFCGVREKERESKRDEEEEEEREIDEEEERERWREREREREAKRNGIMKSVGDRAVTWIIQNRCSYQRRAIVAEEQKVGVIFFMLTERLSLL